MCTVQFGDYDEQAKKNTLQILGLFVSDKMAGINDGCFAAACVPLVA
jgi:hypothetical protein